MNTSDGRYWITYNGEVYNFRTLKSKLQADGYSFHSNSDTEVVLNLYAKYGPAMLDQLNGMFAFAIWDSQERTLFVARDRLGVKPLYYADQKGIFYFASEEKALFAAGVTRDFDLGVAVAPLPGGILDFGEDALYKRRLFGLFGSRWRRGFGWCRCRRL